MRHMSGRHKEDDARPAYVTLTTDWITSDAADVLAAALGIGHRPTPATLQLKADGVFISVRARDRLDITSTLMGLLAQLAHLHPGSPRAMERRLVYGEGTWRIDP